METIINTIHTRYDDVGPADAPALIFIHGFPLDHTMWSGQIEALKSLCRVVAYDLRGHGGSDVGEEAFSMEGFVRDLVAFMDALRIDKATVCAHSMGGYIALHAIEEHPERFNALILTDTQCTADTSAGREKRLKAIRAIAEDGVEPFAEGLIGKLFSSVTLDAKPEVVQQVRDMILGTSPHSLEQSLRAMRERDETCSKLSGISVPVLILVGEADQITPIEAAEYLHDNIEHAHLEIIPQAGHMSNMENPQAFNAALEKFLRAIVSG